MSLPLQGETALVTGASGYLGGVLAGHLSTLGATVIGADKVPPATLRHEHVPLDVRRSFEGLARERRPSIIVHMAYPLTHRRPASQWREMAVAATQNVLAAAEASGARVIALMSSTTAYGAHADNPLLDEENVLRPNADYAYAVGKAQMEALVAAWADRNPDRRVVVTRPCIVLGPGADNYVVRRVFQQAPFVDGLDPRLQFLHEGDFAAAMAALLGKGGPPGVFNLAPDDAGVLRSHVHRLFGMPVEVRSRAEAIAQLSRTWQGGDTEAPHPAIVDYIAHEWCVSNVKLKRCTGWAPALSSLETLLAYSKTLRLQRRREVTA